MKTQLKDIKSEDGEGLMITQPQLCDCTYHNRDEFDIFIKKQSIRQVDVVIDREKLAIYLHQANKRVFGFGYEWENEIAITKAQFREYADALINSKDTWAKIVYLKEKNNG